MLKGLRTVVYHVIDLEAAKTWYKSVFEIEPYFDEIFYVGFDINGFELGLDPSPENYTSGNSNIAYWKVDNIENVMSAMREKNVKIHSEIQNVGGDIFTSSVHDPFGNVIGFIQINE